MLAKRLTVSTFWDLNFLPKHAVTVYIAVGKPPASNKSVKNKKN